MEANHGGTATARQGTLTDEQFWFEFRRGLIRIVRAIDQRYDVKVGKRSMEIYEQDAETTRETR